MQFLRRGKILLIIFAIGTVGGCKQELYQGLPERDANEMLAVLLDNGIDADRSKKDRDGFALSVEHSDVARAVKALSAAGFPREIFKSMDDVFPGGKLVMSVEEQRARLGFGLAQELTGSVGQIPGVSWARVHVALSVRDLRGSETSPATAAVIIRYKPKAELAEIASQARELVSHSVEGLREDQVSVVLTPEPGLPSTPACPAKDSRCGETRVGELVR